MNPMRHVSPVSLQSPITNLWVPFSEQPATAVTNSKPHLGKLLAFAAASRQLVKQHEAPFSLVQRGLERRINFWGNWPTYIYPAHDGVERRTSRIDRRQNGYQRTSAEISKEASRLARQVAGRREIFLKKYGHLLIDVRAWEVAWEKLSAESSDGEEARARRIEAVKKQTLQEYATQPHHKNNDAVTVPHLPNRCNSCQLHVTVLHDSTRCAAKLLAEQEHEAEMFAKRREARRRKCIAALIAEGYWSSDRHDVDIVNARRGTAEGHVITKFDRDLSRKGNKYRIQ
jgi:hypothetical protein